MHRFKYFILIIIFLSISCDNKGSEAFTLVGKTSNIPDSTFVFFHNLFSGRTIDSTIIINNKFRFETKFNKYPNWVLMHTLDRQEFTEVWIEDKSMNFDASKSTFSNGKVSGSISQEVARVYESTDWFSKQPDELNNLKFKFINEYSNSIVAAQVLADNADRWGRDKTIFLYNKLSPEVKNSIFKDRIEKLIKSNQPNLGDKYIDFIGLKNS